MIKKRIVLLIVMIIVAVITIYFTFFFTRSCSDKGCFNNALSKCSRVKYLNDAEDATWLYKIKGKKEGDCEVYVKLLKLKQGDVDIIKLEGRDMLCYIRLGEIGEPQDNLGKCNGLLKEGMQEIMLNKLHKYIADNLGAIGEELQKAI